MTIEEVRKIIYTRDRNQCYNCASTTKLTLDHVKPKFKYHNHKIDNIITLCWKCNNDKFINELSDEKLENVQIYLTQANKQFTFEQKQEMEKVISEYYNSLPKKKKQQNKKFSFKLSNEDWNDLALKDKNGKIIRWSIYRIKE